MPKKALGNLTEDDIRLFGGFIQCVSVANSLFDERMSKHLGAVGLTIAQFGILNFLGELDGSGDRPINTRVSDIANRVQVQQPAVTKAITKFAREGLISVETDRNDKRSKRISLKAKGRKLLSQIRSDFLLDFQSLHKEWTMEELQSFMDQLTKFSTWLRTNNLADK